MPFGQLVIGPPGSGKTTYCNGASQYLEAAGRKVARVNLDPANDCLPYKPDVDVSDLVCLDTVMREMGLGPNGGEGQEKRKEKDGRTRAPALLFVGVVWCCISLVCRRAGREGRGGGERSTGREVGDRPGSRRRRPNTTTTNPHQNHNQHTTTTTQHTHNIHTSTTSTSTTST